MSRRATRRVSISNTAVKVLYNVVEKKQKLESAWVSETLRLPLADQKVLRDVCSGTLRRLDYYSRLIDWTATPKAADNTRFRLLAAATLYQIEHMKHAPGWDSLSEAASDCCDQLIVQKQKPWATRALKELLQDVPEMSLADAERAHTRASALSLPSWLYDRLESTSPMKKYSRILLERPDFLCLFVPPSAYACRNDYISELRGFDPSLTASASSLAPHAVVIQPRPRDVGALPGVSKRLVHVQVCSVSAHRNCGAQAHPFPLRIAATMVSVLLHVLVPPIASRLLTGPLSLPRASGCMRRAGSRPAVRLIAVADAPAWGSHARRHCRAWRQKLQCASRATECEASSHRPQSQKGSGLAGEAVRAAAAASWWRGWR